MTGTGGGGRARRTGAVAAAEVVLVVIGLAGFAVMGLAWAKGAGFAYVPLQIAPLLAATVGLAMVGLAVGALAIQTGRRLDAEAEAGLDGLVEQATEAAAALRRRYVGND
ncbi:MAG TPA: hypothetical protein VE990_09690 [Acidimicrobiales bacterium]|nr:hypothetical protein [Acidimicrobiales bacterium]